MIPDNSPKQFEKVIKDIVDDIEWHVNHLTTEETLLKLKAVLDVALVKAFADGKASKITIPSKIGTFGIDAESDYDRGRVIGWNGCIDIIKARLEKEGGEPSAKKDT